MADRVHRRPWGIFLFAVGAAILVTTGVAWIVFPVEYEAFALLKISRYQPTVLDDGAVRTDDDFEIFKRTQVQLVGSYAVLNGTLHDPAIMKLPSVQMHLDDPTTWLKEDLSVDYPDDAEIMRISMRGPDRDDVVAIVDRLTDVYLREIVNRDKQERVEHEEELSRAYAKQKAEYERQLEALATLEKIHQTTGSGAAELRKMVAMDELKALLRQREQISEEIRQTNVEIEIAEARAEMATEVRTGAGAASHVALAEELPVAVLMRKRGVLETQIGIVERQIASQMKVLDGLESFSEEVATKKEEVEALRSIKNRLGAEVDRARVERLAPDRIRLVDRAVLADDAGNAVRRGLAFAAVATCGLLLIAAGLILEWPRRKQVENSAASR